MKCNRSERDKEVTMISNPERIICDLRRTTAASTAATPVEDPPFALLYLDAAQEKVARQVSTVESEDTFNGFSDKTCVRRTPRSEYPAYSVLLVSPTGQYRQQSICQYPGRSRRHRGTTFWRCNRATESSADTKGLLEIRTS